MAIWPTSLPTYPDDNGFKENYGKVLVTSQTDIGPMKVRRRATTGLPQIEAQYTLTASQVTTFFNFYTGSISGGASQFSWHHPRLETDVAVIIKNDPNCSSQGFDQYTITLTLEVIS